VSANFDTLEILGSNLEVAQNGISSK
ncbi:hypothetical protein SAMN05192543_1225, partial [Paraburkholderia megapolitana]